MSDLQYQASESIALKADKIACIRDDRVLFRDLSFQLLPKQVLLLEGSNGAGKTTLLRVLCGIRSQDEGQISWCGESLDAFTSRYYGDMIYLGHLDGIKRDLTVLENLQMAQSLGRPGKMKLFDALDRMGLAGYEYTPARQLSAGQKRRVALARLLVVEARLWILDEPFTSLDRETIRDVEQMITEHTQQQGMVVMTSHHEVVLDGVMVQRIRLVANA